MSVPTQIIARQREWDDREWFPPGPQLAVCLSGGKERLADLTDDELLQVAAAARRQTSWAQARELAAIAELTQRRTRAEDDGDPDYRILPARESVTEEIAAALTVTGNAAATLVHLAERLTGPLAETGAALETGRIDLAKARVVSDLTDSLPQQVAQRVQAAALEKASTQTTGQLRRRIRRLTQRLAPDAIEDRKREAVRQRRLEVWDTPSGTADLGLCDIAPEDAHAIYNKITAAAHGMKIDGDPRPLQNIRADLATQLLHGTELPDAIRDLLARKGDPPPPDAMGSSPGGASKQTTSTSSDLPALPAGVPGAPTSLSGAPPHANTLPVSVHGGASSGITPHSGSVHRLPQRAPAGSASGGDDAPPREPEVTGSAGRSGFDSGGGKGGVACEHELIWSGDPPRELELTDCGGSIVWFRESVPVDSAGSGGAACEAGLSTPLDADPVIEAEGRSGDEAALVVLADVIGQRLAHVSGRVPSRELPGAIRRAVQRIQRELAGAREAACRGDDEVHGRPGYRPPAAMRREVETRHETCVFPSCNQPSHRCDLDHTVPWRPGTTCRCNLAPLCRRHHRLKQRPDWRLVQVWPGLLVWVTPSGAWHIVRPDRQ